MGVVRPGVALEPPLAKRGGGVARVGEDAGQRVVVREGFVELVVADVGVALGDAEHERRARRGADRRGAVGVGQQDALLGHRINVRRTVRGLIGAGAGVLPQHAQVAVAQVVAEDEDDVAIVRTIIALADNLGLETIAEGVETKKQIDFLTKEGCFIIQGYYYSKPLSREDCEAFLRKHT